MKTLIKILGCVSMVTVSSVPAISKIIDISYKDNHVPLIDDAGKDVTYKIENLYFKIKEMNSVDEFSNIYNSKDIIDVFEKAVVASQELVSEKFFYDFMNLFFNFLNKYKKTLQNISVDGGLNLFEYGNQVYQLRIKQFSQKNNFNSNGLVSKYQELKNKEMSLIVDLNNKLYSDVMVKLSKNVSSISKLSNQLESWIKEVETNNKLLSIYSKVKKVNELSRNLFNNFRSLFNSLTESMISNHGKAKWHADHYKNALIPIYGIFYVDIFKGALQDMVNAMQAYEEFVDKKPDSDLLKKMNKANDGINKYTDDIIKNIDYKKEANEILKKLDVENSLNFENKSMNSVLNFLVDSFGSEALDGISKFLETFFAPEFQAKALSINFYSLEIYYNKVYSRYKEYKEELDESDKKLKQINFESDKKINHFLSQNEILSKKIINGNLQLDNLQKENENINENKRILDSFVIKSYKNLRMSSFVIVSEDKSIVTDDKIKLNYKSPNNFSNILKELKKISKDRNLVYSKILDNANSSDDYIKDLQFNNNQINHEEINMLKYYSEYERN